MWQAHFEVWPCRLLQAHFAIGLSSTQTATYSNQTPAINLSPLSASPIHQVSISWLHLTKFDGSHGVLINRTSGSKASRLSSLPEVLGLTEQFIFCNKPLTPLHVLVGCIRYRLVFRNITLGETLLQNIVAKNDNLITCISCRHPCNLPHCFFPPHYNNNAPPISIARA